MYANRRRVRGEYGKSLLRRRGEFVERSFVFTWVLGVLADHGVLQGKRIAIDATTLEANAAMRSIVRRDTGESYASR